MILEAALEVLSPFINETREVLESIKRDIRAVGNRVEGIDLKLDTLDSKQKELNMKVMSLNMDLEHYVLRNITQQLPQTSDFLHESLAHTCGGTGGWRRVVYLDMTDPNTNCPSGWHLTGHSKRTCGRINPSRLTCDSVIFPVSGGTYTSVCGTIRAYQYRPTDGFQAYDDGEVTTIDGAYVSGVSLTHGSPRQHIWTFTAGASEEGKSCNHACPCDATINIAIPPFVGGDYFCESGVNFGPIAGFHPYDPLWDGENCSSSSTCCSFNNPPYFTKTLPNPTTDDIEARLCQLDDGNTPIEFIDLYIKFEDNMKKLEALTKDKLQHDNNVTEELMKISATLNENLQQVEQNVLSHVTMELQNTYDSLREDQQQLENRVTQGLQMTCDKLPKDLYTCGGTGG